MSAKKITHIASYIGLNSVKPMASLRAWSWLGLNGSMMSGQTKRQTDNQKKTNKVFNLYLYTLTGYKQKKTIPYCINIIFHHMQRGSKDLAAYRYQSPHCFHIQNSRGVFYSVSNIYGVYPFFANTLENTKKNASIWLPIRLTVPHQISLFRFYFIRHRSLID